MQGLPILDALGEPLTSLYQYCVYQFPWRPWRSHGLLASPDPYEFEGGILAPWVPPAEDIRDWEKQQVDSWLERWLVETETVIKARNEWRQLRVREYNAQTREHGQAVLREMCLAVLAGLPLRLPSHQSLAEGAEERELRLGELLQERVSRGSPAPWLQEGDEARALEALVTFCAEMTAGRELFLGEKDVKQPALIRSVFGIKYLHLHTTAEPSDLAVPASSDAVPRPFSTGSLRARRMCVACELPLQHLQLLAKWMLPFGFSVRYDSLAMPVRESWLPLYATCSGPGAPPGTVFLDSMERAVSVLAVLTVHVLAARKEAPLSPALILVLWSTMLLALRFLTSSGDLRRCLVWMPMAVLSFLLWTQSHQSQLTWHAILLDRCCVGAMVTILLLLALRTLRELLAFDLAQTMPMLSREPDSYDDSSPPWGSFTAMDGPLSFVMVVPLLGICLNGEACHVPGMCTDERRRSICRKQLAVYESPTDSEDGTGRRLHELERLDEIQRTLPLAISRAQLAGTEELHELACTIHVVNHVGCSWSSIRHDSFLSLHKPWGLDLQPARGKECCGGAADERDKTQLTVENSALVKAWHQEVVDWLHGELAAAGTLKHTALDAMLHGGRSDRGAFALESDHRVVPGIFSNDGIGERKHSESRCFREGRVLHYVIPSTELKAGFVWRPDPLAAEAAELLSSDQWRPCLLRLTSRSISYLLRKQDGGDQGGPFPEWPEPVVRDHGDLVEYNVSFLFLDRIEVEVDRGLVMLQERDRGILGDSIAVPDYAPRSLPLVFRVRPESARVWRGVVKRSRMSGRRENIVNYVGPVREHPYIPNVCCRHGTEGEQLWDNGFRYVGSWESHVYHGHGELVDTSGAVIYRGQWERGLKHGEGTYFFHQNDIQRAYSGQWVYDEFSGVGELRVLDQSLETLRRRQPYTISRYHGKFAVARGQFAPAIDLSSLEPGKHTALIKAYFPTRMISRDSSLSSSTLLDERPLMQSSGDAPRDCAGQFYLLDGGDLSHCGPDDDCQIRYVDGTQYFGPCLAGAVPHGADALLVEPNGTRYEGSFDHGLRVGPGLVTLASGISYEGTFSYPGGQTEGEGRLRVPADQQQNLGFVLYAGQFKEGRREGVGQVQFPDGAIYKGEFRGNQRHGHGRQIEGSGVEYDGPWETDEIGNGTVSIVYATGHCYSGSARGGYRHGPGILLEPNGEHWALLYEGEWRKDRMHGEGTLFCPDGVYTGQFVWGDREGKGRFEYRFPKNGHPLPSPDGRSESGPLAAQRMYDGSWKSDQQHGQGRYVDEYGYEIEEAVAERGSLKSEPRRPGRRGLRERLLHRSERSSELAPFAVQPSPGKRLPGGSMLLTSRAQLLPNDPPSMQGLDTGVGYANGRTRPAHLGLEGVPGSRWA